MKNYKELIDYKFFNWVNKEVEEELIIPSQELVTEITESKDNVVAIMFYHTILNWFSKIHNMYYLLEPSLSEGNVVFSCSFYYHDQASKEFRKMVLKNNNSKYLFKDEKEALVNVIDKMFDFLKKKDAN